MPEFRSIAVINQSESAVQVLQIVTTDQLSLWTRCGSEVSVSLALATSLVPAMKLLAYMTGFWRPYVLNALGLSDSEGFPFILDFFGLHWGDASFWPHWTLVGIVGLLIFALRRLDFRLRCTGPDFCSENFVGSVACARDRIPRAVQDLLATKGYRIVASTRVVDAMPALLQVTPRWSGHTTHEHLPALFIPQLKLIVLSEFYKSRNSWVKVDLDIFYMLAHEVGHALDHSLKGVTNTRRFKETYLADYARLNSDDKSRLTYFIQNTSKFGMEETFAEIFSSVLGQSQCADIEQKFPETAKLVREVLLDKVSIASRGAGTSGN